MSEDHGQDDRLDAAEVARMLGVSKATVYTMLEDGKLSGFLAGTRRKKIYRSSVDRWIADHSFGTADPNGNGTPPKKSEAAPPNVPKKRGKKKK